MTMKKILLLILLASGVFAQGVRERIIMQKPASIRGSSTTLNGSTQYASVTPSLRLTGDIALSISRVTSDSAAVSNQVYGQWSFTVNKDGDGDAIDVYIISDINTVASNNGYKVTYGTDEKMYLYSIAAGTPTARITSTGTFAYGSTHSVVVTRNTNGAFNLLVNGTSVGTVTNATYVSPNYTYFDVTANDVVGTIRYEYGEGSLDLNSYERFRYSMDRFFELTTPNWANAGSYNFARSTYTPITGTYSYRGIVGQGDATTNNIVLDKQYFVTLVSGDKTTLEFNARDSSYTAGDSIYCKIGDKTKGIAFADANTKKFVFNFQNTASTVDQNIIVWIACASGTRVIKIDDTSLTKAWDGLLNIWLKRTSASTTYSIWGTALGTWVRFTTSEALRPTFSDGTYSNTLANYTVTNSASQYNLYTILFNKTSNILLYQNGGLVGTIDATIFGKINLTSIVIGQNGSAGEYFAGNVGETQYFKFTDIATSNVSASTLLSAYRGGLPRTWTGGINVFSVKWRGTTDGQFLSDYSGLGNNCVGTNVTKAGNQTTGSYPAK